MNFWIMNVSDPSHGMNIYTIKGLRFKYTIENDCFYPNRTNYRISKSDFKKAYDLVPIDGPGKINSLVRGPAYVWAVLYDKRISKGEW